MIHARFEKIDGGKAFVLNVDGHADYAEKGKDIICSAASIITYTLAQAVIDAQNHGGLKKKPTIRMDEGNSAIVCKPGKGALTEIMYAYRFAEIGFALLAQSYPDYVRVKLFGEG